MENMNRNSIFAIIILCIVLIFSVAFSYNEKKDEKERPDWNILIKSDDEKERAMAKKIVSEQYNENVEYLISIVNEPLKENEEFYASNTPRNISFYLLGKLRAKKAVPALLDWLIPKTGQRQTIDEIQLFSPAGYALIEIGLPSVPPLVDLLKTSQNTFSREKYIKIIVAIKGIPETEFLFNNILAKETSPEKIENIKTALGLLKDLKYQKIFENAAKSSDSPE